MSRIPLNVHTAEITTASVEIKTLTVRGKQVTLALFRQLEEITLMNSKDGSLEGVPWGWVNYHPDKDCPSAAHMHVVWQKDNSLYRSAVVVQEFYYERIYPQRDAWDQWLMFNLEGYKGFDFEYCEIKDNLRVIIDDVEFRTGIRDYQVSRDGDNLVWSSMKPKNVIENLKNIDPDEVRQLVADTVREEIKRREQIDATVQKIIELPQLFIAVQE